MAARPRRHPHLGPRLQHGGADRGCRQSRLPRRNRAGRVEPRERARSRPGPRSSSIADRGGRSSPLRLAAGLRRGARPASSRTARSTSSASPASCALLTDWFVERWRDRMINIHPSLLPAFPGLDTHARALEAGVTFHGCTVHFVRAADRRRTDHRAGGGAGAAGRYAGGARRAGARRRAPALPARAGAGRSAARRRVVGERVEIADGTSAAT